MRTLARWTKAGRAVADCLRAPLVHRHRGPRRTWQGCRKFLSAGVACLIGTLRVGQKSQGGRFEAYCLFHARVPAPLHPVGEARNA